MSISVAGTNRDAYRVVFPQSNPRQKVTLIYGMPPPLNRHTLLV
jgi:hypothetical protein